ncbi:MAG: ATP-dependent sacrificial sulfur transferase LarE [Clostridiales bacterium]|nr:ATP-dependent sacrificial sulfur transferase LarE [Clostridiales bacterium]
MTLREFFEKNDKVAIGFSGGVDSSYLLYAAKKYDIDIKAYYVKTQFQPEFEFNDAMKLAKNIGADLEIIVLDILKYGDIKSNPSNRCYYCKNKIFTYIKERAIQDGYTMIIDGTNASDDINTRPGFKALHELEIKSPLRECGITKEDVRELSKKAGLFTWDKAAYSCLATRIYTGNNITEEKLRKIEKSEKILFDMGFSDFRVRMYYDIAKLQFRESEFEMFFSLRSEILRKLEPFFDDILFDLKGR